MSEPTPTPEPLTFPDLVLSELKKRKVKPECAACGLIGWPSFEIPQFAFDLPYMVQGQFARMALLICNRCGHPKEFVISKWGVAFQQEERRVITPDQIRQQQSPLVMPG